MGCVFCATGRLGLTRHLKRWEIVAQVLAVRSTLREGERITGAVFMGQGEPLHNYDEVIAAACVLSDPCGGRVDARNISISTVGLVPQMRRYALEGHKFRLVVSLHSAVPERRRELLPIAKTWSLEQVLRQPIVRRYSGGKNREAACGMLASTHQERASTT